MSESQNCSHNCEACGSNCAERTAPQSFLEKPKAGTRVKKVIGIVSGKGGVGKSLVTSLLSSSMQKRGYSCAVLDADITGPSIPRMFGIINKASSYGDGIMPEHTKEGIKVMSVNLLLENDTDPVVWRGPIIAGMVKQFWTNVNWGEVDFMFVDMPPGTGDVPLTVFQSLPVDGIVVVTSPQELVGMIVGKAVNMAEMMNIPVLGLVENMAYYICPSCNGKHCIFGDSHVEQIAAQYGIEVTSQIPVEPALAAACDNGRIADFNAVWLDNLTNRLAALADSQR